MSVCVDHKSTSQHVVVTHSRVMHTGALAYGRESSPHQVSLPQTAWWDPLPTCLLAIHDPSPLPHCGLLVLLEATWMRDDFLPSC